MNRARRKPAWLCLIVFLGVFSVHALVYRETTLPARIWTDGSSIGSSFHGFGPYLHNLAYCTGFSYALAAMFTTWALARFIRSRRFGWAIGTAAGSGWVGFLATSTCLFTGCCGSPLMEIVLAVFGPRLLPFGRPLAALLTLAAVGFGYWHLRRFEPRECIVLDEASLTDDDKWLLGRTDQPPASGVTRTRAPR